ncbi:MAG: hypothetical protein GF393_00225 [Armatimonadia bacterium]|nr:hypothetical protein [Armatimonadia bacterium]
MVERRPITRAAVALALAFAACAASHAEDPREPAVATLRSGGMSVELQRAHSWSIQQIVFRGVPVATRTGAFGAVVSVPVAGGWVGSGHTAGGVERVEDVSLIVDGEFVDLQDGATYTGERLVLQKTSMLDKLRLDATLTLTGGVLTERHELTATEDVVVSVTYPFMHPISSATTQWMAETDTCEEIGGEFGNGEDLRWYDDWTWTAAHIPDRSTGIVMRHLDRPDDVLTLTAWWDQERYHKLYVRWGGAMEPWPQGLTLAGEIALRCFEAPPPGWREMARQVAAELVAE